MKIGVRAHDFGKLPAEELAKVINAKGFNCIQLALAKAIEGVEPTTDLDKLDANGIKKAFDNNNIEVAVLGYYNNPIHPYPEEREKILNGYKNHLRVARDYGCSIVGTETGSVNPDYSFNEESFGQKAFDTLCESVSILAKEAEKYGVNIGIEGVASHPIRNSKRMKELVDNVNSKHFKVIFDPVNYLTIDNYKDQQAIMYETFELLGDKIAVIHAKDFVINNGKIQCVQIGEGNLDYKLLTSLVKQQDKDMFILIEGVMPEKAEKCISHISELMA